MHWFILRQVSGKKCILSRVAIDFVMWQIVSVEPGIAQINGEIRDFLDNICPITKSVEDT